ncbi:GIY-YIG nuclease family protein [Lysinibacillus sp. FSL P4-0201]|uniref:GIY-YIG nuclease family protein n=1 Tax=Lysinibacillus sp. FSL P4-0201 TaxID=2921721 RepID=UPI00315A02AB
MMNVNEIKYKDFGVKEYYVWEQQEIQNVKGYGVYTFFDLNGEPLYVGRSNNIGERVLNHIHGKTTELARNKFNYIDKDHYKYLHSVRLISLSTEDFIWLEAYVIARLEPKPVFNKEFRSDLPDDPKQLNLEYKRRLDLYFEENETRKRGSEDSEWSYYHEQIMKFYQSKRVIEYGVKIEDVVLMQIFQEEAKAGNIKKNCPDLKSFIKPSKRKGKLNHKEEIIEYIASKSSGWTKEKIIKHAINIGLKKERKIPNLNAIKFTQIRV